MKVRHFRILTLVLVLVLLVVPTHTSQTPKLLLDGAVPSVLPFQEGEQLVYEVNWKPLFLLPAFKAGELTLKLSKSEFGKHPTYTISGEAVSAGTLASVAGIEVRDYFESTIDRRNFRSYRLIKQLREGQRKRDVEVLFNYDADHIKVREVDMAVDPPKEVRNEIIQGLVGPVTDILSVFYVTRLKELKRDDQYLIHLSDEGETRSIRTQVERVERINTQLGRFDTVKLDTGAGLFRGGGGLRVWYSNDGLRIPVKFEADVRFGKVYGQLIRMNSGSISRGIIRTSD